MAANGSPVEASQKLGTLKHWLLPPALPCSCQGSSHANGHVILDSQVEEQLVEMGDIDLAKECMAALIQGGCQWVATAAKVEMVRHGQAKVWDYLL